MQPVKLIHRICISFFVRSITHCFYKKYFINAPINPCFYFNIAIAVMFTKSKVAVFAISIMFVYLVFNLSGWDRKDMLAFDESGYYLYLPATFIYHDLGNVNFDSVITAKYNLSFG